MRRAILTMLAVACGEEPAADVTFVDVREQVLSKSCAMSACHGSGAGALTLDGTDADYDRLVDVASTVGTPLVAPGDPDGSYLVQKMEDAPGITGDLMPLGGLVDDEGAALIRDWIGAGAPR